MNTVAFNKPIARPHTSTRLLPIPKPPCFYDEALWDMDASDFGDIQYAAQLCKRVCPRLSACDAELKRRINDGDSPKNQVMAGQPFNSRGTYLSTDIKVLDHMAKLAGAESRYGASADAPTVVDDTREEPETPDNAEHVHTLGGDCEQQRERTIRLTVVEDLHDEPATHEEAKQSRALDAKREQQRELLKALDREVETKAGMQFALGLGA